MKKKNKEIDILDFELLYDHILVKAVESSSRGVLVNPEQYDAKPEFGEILKCGEGRLLEDGTVVPLNVSVGDTIYFGKYSSVQLRSAGNDYFVIRADDIMAKRTNGNS